MGNKRREVEKNLSLFLNPGGAASEGGYLIPMDNLNVGPGKPGPGDEWHVPTGLSMRSSLRARRASSR